MVSLCSGFHICLMSKIFRVDSGWHQKGDPVQNSDMWSYSLRRPIVNKGAAETSFLCRTITCTFNEDC